MIRKLWGRRFVLAGLAAVTIIISAPRLSADNQAPARVVSAFHASLLEIMRAADSLGFDGRYARIRPSIEDSFHLPVMARIAIGSFWRKASPLQQAQLIQVFGDISVGTYANRFSGFSGQSFQTKQTREGPHKTVLVDTVLKNPTNRDVTLTYVCREINGAWRIIDVLLDAGISELAVRRSEYRRILKTRGIDGLIAILQEKARDLQSSD